MKYKDWEVSKGEALRIAADLDMRDGKVNDLCAFRCSECNGFIAYRRGRVPDHFGIGGATRREAGGTRRADRRASVAQVMTAPRPGPRGPRFALRGTGERLRWRRVAAAGEKALECTFELGHAFAQVGEMGRLMPPRWREEVPAAAHVRFVQNPGALAARRHRNRHSRWYQDRVGGGRRRASGRPRSARPWPRR